MHAICILSVMKMEEQSINEIITILLGNLPIGLVALAALLGWAFKRGEAYAQSLTRFMLLLPVGAAGIWGFYYHAFFPEETARHIGWANTPFQFEVAAANLGMGVTGIVGFWKNKDFAFAVILMATCFLWGAAAIHIKEIILQGDFSPGNAGSILFSDILIPAILCWSYFLWKD